jgi:hypothetical protein
VSYTVATIIGILTTVERDSIGDKETGGEYTGTPLA